MSDKPKEDAPPPVPDIKVTELEEHAAPPAEEKKDKEKKKPAADKKEHEKKHEKKEEKHAEKKEKVDEKHIDEKKAEQKKKRDEEKERKEKEKADKHAEKERLKAEKDEKKSTRSPRHLFSPRKDKEEKKGDDKKLDDSKKYDEGKKHEDAKEKAPEPKKKDTFVVEAGKEIAKEDPLKVKLDDLFIPDQMEQVKLTTADCPIQHVTVFNDRAEILRNVSVTLKQGAQAIVVTGFPSSVLENSVRVSGGVGEATILEVAYNSRREERRPDNVKVQEQEERLKKMTKDKEKLQRQLDRLVKHRALLVGYSNRVSAAIAKEGLNPAAVGALTGFLSFYESSLADTDKQELSLNRELQAPEVTKHHTALQADINRQAPVSSTEWREVTITVHAAKSNTPVVLQLTYLTHNTSWESSYDVRVNSADKKLELTYYGTIKQASGEDWKNVRLALSTATPSLGGVCPTLNTARVHFVAPQMRRTYERTSSVVRSAKNKDMSRHDNAREEEADAGGGGAFGGVPAQVLTTVAETSQTSTTFEIPRLATIETDNKPHKVNVAFVKLDAKFKYSGVPKLDTHAYLQASATNTSDYPFLAGAMNVFFDNNFVAQSHLKGVSPSETFDSFLGADNAIKIEYRPVEKTRETAGLFTKTQTEIFTHKTIVKNTKSIEIELILVDQLPLSSDKEIKVKLLDPDFTKVPTAKQLPSNNVEWTLKLKPSEELEVPFKYAVEWPLNRELERF